jgi:hypothetical protein
VQALCKVLQSAPWHSELRKLPGYRLATPAAAGQVLSLRTTLPWWNFRSAKH